eukprot:jgi/Tetstr1/436454/TSEL_025282.t1
MDCAASEVGTLPDEVHVTPDGGVLKSVVRQGSNDDLCPSLHSRCLVHYKGVIADTGETFMDTRQEAAAPATVVAGRVTSEVGTGLSAALMHMRRGEVARVRCSAQYGYGSKGNFSFPSVPPNAALVYEVELLSWEEADDSMEDPREVVFFEDKVEAAERRRQQGNDLYRAGNVVGALSKYTMALSFIPEDMLMQLQGFMRACHLKLQDWEHAIQCCDQALDHDADNAKALFRRGLKQLERTLSPQHQERQNDSAIKKHLQALCREEKATRKATAHHVPWSVSRPSRSGAIRGSDVHTEPG